MNMNNTSINIYEGKHTKHNKHIQSKNRNKTKVINLVIFNIIADSLLCVHGGKIKIDFLT